MKSLVLLAMFSPAFALAQTSGSEVSVNPTTTDSGVYYAANGEGKTLPEGVARFRAPVRFYSIDKVYDDKGKEEKLPIEAKITAGAFVFEYGLSDRLSLQAKLDYYYGQSVKLKNDSGIKESKAFKDELDKTLAAQVAAGTCPSADACRATFEPLVLAGMKAKLESEQKADGNTGLGDTEVGALYALVTTDDAPVAVSVGGGLRLPTGKSAEAKKLQTTRYTTDLGLRLNVDYPIVDGLFLAWQHQAEIMLQKGKMKVGDTKLDYSRKGMRHVGFLKTAWGLGNVTPALSVLGLYGSYNYDLEPKAKVGDVEEEHAHEAYGATVGTVIDGLAYEFPAQLELEYFIPTSGKSARAAQYWGATLKAFYKF